MNPYQITKAEAIEIFENQRKLAAALEVNPSVITRYPDLLSLRVSRQIIGAATQLGRMIPSDLQRRFLNKTNGLIN